MPSNLYDLWVTKIWELDLIYEGLSEVREGLCTSNRKLIKKLIDLEEALADEIFRDEDDQPVISDRAKEISNEIRDKKALINEIGKKLNRLHQLQKRLTDPSVPKELVDDYNEKTRQKTIDSIMEKSL